MSSAGSEAVDLARSAGLILDDWQAWVLEHACGERADGLWAARDVGVLVPRQNGKGTIAEARQLAGMVLFGERLIIHTAHEFRTAREHLRRMAALVETCDELRRMVKAIRWANGNECIELSNGCQLKFAARTSGGGRGLTADLVWLDESQKLTADAIAALTPALAAVPNPQVWYTGSACMPDSEVQHSLIRRAESDSPGRLFFADWGCGPDVDTADRSAWAAANPALHVRISEEFLEAQHVAMADLGSVFAREHLGVHDMPDLGSGVFDLAMWSACGDPDGRIVAPAAIALDVSPWSSQAMTFASFAAAGRRSDGIVQVEIVRRAPGTDWVVAEAKALQAETRLDIVVDPKSPAVVLADDLRAAGVTVRELPGGEFPKACVALQRAVHEGRLRHRAQVELAAAQAGAAVQPYGETWVWRRASSHVSIDALVAATVAYWAATSVAMERATVELFV